jgi:16S rRNA (guanine966-N2)-methyltransferase
VQRFERLYNWAIGGRDESMRVIAGKAKGRRLKSVPGAGTRPITDRAKSALFSILGNSIVNARFLDLFAGTGSVGIEAISRGAAEAVFVERGRVAVRTVRENLAHTQLANRGHIERADVFEYLTRASTPYDFVYLAPPQYRGLWAETLRVLDQKPDWLYNDGWVIAQLDPREYEALPLQALAQFDERTYGGVMLSFYGRVVETDAP